MVKKSATLPLDGDADAESPTTAKPRLVSAPSPSRSSSSTIGLTPHPMAVTLYQENEFWKEETTLSKVEEWTVSELTGWIESSVRRLERTSYVEQVPKLLKVMEQENIYGGLLLAGGKTYLAEKAHYAFSGKRDRMRLPHVVNVIFEVVNEAQARQGAVSYWNRLWRESSGGYALCEEFESNVEGVGARMRLALEPHPLEDVSFEAVICVDRASVIEADALVDKAASSEVVGNHRFKVVSVSARGEPSTVLSNLVYARSDVGLLSDQTAAETATMAGAVAAAPGKAISRKQRRKEKRSRAGRRWELLASVDFAKHGSALPGHWHLNSTSCGGILPHLGVSARNVDGADGDFGVWHGREDCCPLWWQFIPSAMTHKEIPQRLKGILEKR